MISSNNFSLLMVFTLLMTGCGRGSSGGSGESAAPANNMLSITVNGSLCSASTSAGYLNKPCVSVTVCNPGGTSTCQTIDDILLDTGSFGLRIFKQALTTVSLTQVTIGSGSLAECAQFGDGSVIWGPVQTASVILGNEPAVQVPVQVGDSTFATFPTTSCTGVLLASPADAGFNGILGVGVFTQDCGPACTSTPKNKVYYTCTGSTCSGATVPLTSQVQNPVALLPLDNNGVIVELPAVSPGGASSASGSLVLGIGTQANNAVPSGVIAYGTNPGGEIMTTISGNTYSAVIDSGSNGYFFTPPAVSQLPACSPFNTSWFCPSSAVNISATNAGASGAPSSTVSFEIGNFTSLISSNNNVFSNIGGTTPGMFDWGLPFYFGRNVYVGIEGGKPSSLGSGPYFAY